MSDTPGRVEVSPDDEKVDENDLPVALWELGRQFEDLSISALRRRVTGLTQSNSQSRPTHGSTKTARVLRRDYSVE